MLPPPGRQGPGPMPTALVEALDLVVARRAAGALPGDRRAAGVGRGTELAQLRPYEVGDDVRQIDAAATARTGVPHVRLHVPERTLTTWIVLDVSAVDGVRHGRPAEVRRRRGRGARRRPPGRAPRRARRAAHLRRADPRLIPPRGGRRRVAPAPRRSTRASPPTATTTRTRSPTRSCATGRVARQPGFVVVISDFRGQDDWTRALGALRARHSVLAVEIGDPREAELPAVGRLALVDPETGERVEVDTSRPALRERFADAARQEREPSRASCAGCASTTSCSPPRATGCASSGGACGELRHRPAVLLALFAIPAIIGDLRARPAPPAQVRRALHRRCPTLAGSGRRRRVALAAPPPAALLARRRSPALVLALAKPQTTVAVPVEQASVMLVTDHSRSMLADDVAPTRLAAAQQAARDFLDKVPERGARRRGRVLRRARRGRRRRRTDRDDVRPIVDGLVADGGTATGDALQSRSTPWTTRASAARAARPRRSSCSPTARRRRARPGRGRPRGRQARIPIYTVALGTPDATVPGGFGGRCRCRPTPRRCARSPRSPAARAFTAEDADALPSIYKTLGSQLARSRRSADHGGLRRRRARAAARRGVRRAAHPGRLP